MSKEAILNNLYTNLHLEVLPNESKDDSIAFINTLLYSKHDQNSDIIRSQVLQSFATNNTKLRDNLNQYSNIITQDKFNNDLILSNTKHQSELSQTRRKSINFESDQVLNDEDNDNDNDDEDENVSQLRKRLLHGNRSKSQDSELLNNEGKFDETLHYEEQKQEDILQDMFQFVRSIKDGADAFNAKLNEDSNVLKAAEAGLDVTSKKLNKTKKDLSKTISALGLFDALKLFGVVILLFFLSLIIIKIFPKW